MSNDMKIEEVITFIKATREEAITLAYEIGGGEVHELRIMRGFTPATEPVGYLVLPQPVQPAMPMKYALVDALERAGAAESALRRLVDECENEGTPNWQTRMIECIDHANRLLARNATIAQPEQPVPSDQDDAKGALQLALAYVRWQAFGECRSPGHDSPPPTAAELDAALVAALAILATNSGEPT